MTNNINSVVSGRQNNSKIFLKNLLKIIIDIINIITELRKLCKFKFKFVDHGE